MKKGLFLGMGVVAVGVAWWAFRPLPVDRPTHEVVRGDTLWAIANTNEVTVEQLRAWNGLRGDRIEVGQILLVGAGEGHPEMEVNEPLHRGGVRGRSPSRSFPVEEPGSFVALQMPDPVDCLSGPDEGEGFDHGEEEPAYVGSVGLGRSQVRSAMNAFLPELGRCVDGAWPQGSATLAITVGCDGRVMSVDVEAAGDLSDPLLLCVTRTLRYAPFPAHDIPGGFTFHYPMHFESD